MRKVRNRDGPRIESMCSLGSSHQRTFLPSSAPYNLHFTSLSRYNQVGCKNKSNRSTVLSSLENLKEKKPNTQSPWFPGHEPKPNSQSGLSSCYRSTLNWSMEMPEVPLSPFFQGSPPLFQTRPVTLTF